MMLLRRAEQAGYTGVTPHQFRHTFSDDWLRSGGSEGDLLRLNGWKWRAMDDRYADDVANQRALDAKRRRGEMSARTIQRQKNSRANLHKISWHRVPLPPIAVRRLATGNRLSAFPDIMTARCEYSAHSMSSKSGKLADLGYLLGK
jgi:hypothetical protein